MKSTAIIAAVATALLAVSTKAAPLVWSDCSTGPTQVTDATFKMDGEWSCLGEKVCGTLTGNFTSPLIEGSQLSVEVRYLGRLTGSYRGDLCAILKESGYNCPIPAGPKTLHACINYNATVPNINTVATVQARNGDGYTLFCQKTPAVMNKNCTLTPNP
ncbi:hypothetical protein BGZ97_011325 [Linnemannia gamsii]|uniref:Phosphatidylglycerol/phosphatidylinositol transfer protein n=1 Tax=Linnemannia gamsii TaxID=64522 RepID=A0A9P6RJ53_9FUNG|nr:hypothetical protein BGZ97_011325 [Linnemannia gamsii]